MSVGIGRAYTSLGGGFMKSLYSEDLEIYYKLKYGMRDIEKKAKNLKCDDFIEQKNFFPFISKNRT